MKKLGLFIIMISFMACQSEKKTNTSVDSNQPAITTDSLSFKYDSLKVYSKHPVLNGQVTDTTKVEISYPLFANEKLNQLVKQEVENSADADKHYKSYNEYAADFIKDYDNFKNKEKSYNQAWFLTVQTTVVNQKPNYLSFLTINSSYMGGAHPNTVYIYHNYNPSTDQEIVLDSLIQPGTLPELTAVAEKIFRKNEKLAPNASLKDNYFFEKDKFKLNDNFTITATGLEFLYNPYEIKAYVYGKIELTIPFAELKNIARPNSLLSRSN